VAAPKGNTNALKHGLYAKHYSPEEQKELRRMSFDDLQHEINAMRKVAADILEEHNKIKAGGVVDLEQLARTDNSLCNAIDKVSLCAIRHSVLTGNNPTVNDSMLEALLGMKQFDPEDESDPR